MIDEVQTRRLQLLLELSRHGSMRAVADELGITTSTVSQQIAVLAREVGVALIEPVGRRVRLTPAGRRLAEHAVTILAAVEAARADLDPDTEPAGTLRIAGFATAVRRSLLPVVARPGRRAIPRCGCCFHEHEPAEAFALLAPTTSTSRWSTTTTWPRSPSTPCVSSTPLWSTPWGLGSRRRGTDRAGERARVFGRYPDHDWIVNSRNTADEQVVRTARARWPASSPRVAHRADSLDWSRT